MPSAVVARLEQESTHLAAASLVCCGLGLAVLLSPLHLPGAVLFVGGVAGLALFRPSWAIWLILMLFPLYPFLSRVATVNFGVSGGALLVASAWKEIALAVVLAVGVGRLALNLRNGTGTRVRLTMLDWMAAILFVMVGVGLAVRHDMLALNAARLLWFPIGVYAALRFLQLDTRRYFRAVVALAVAIASFGMIQSSFFGRDWVATYWPLPYAAAGPPSFASPFLNGQRAAATLPSPNDLGFALMVFSVVIVSLLMLDRAWARWTVPGLVVVLAGLAMTFSRSASAGAVVGIAVLIAVGLWRLSSDRRRTAVVLAATLIPSVLLVGVIYEYRGGPALFQSVFTTLSAEGSEDSGATPALTPAPSTAAAEPVTPQTTPPVAAVPGAPSPVVVAVPTSGPSIAPTPTPAPQPNPADIDPSTSQHLSSLSQAWALVKANPLGIGLGTVGARVLPGSSDPSDASARPRYIVESWYLAMGVMLGWAGLLWTVLMPLAWLWTAVTAIRRGRRLAGLALLGASVAVALMAIVLPSMLEPELAMLPWALGALAVSGPADREESGEPSETPPPPRKSNPELQPSNGS